MKKTRGLISRALCTDELTVNRVCLKFTIINDPLIRSLETGPTRTPLKYYDIEHSWTYRVSEPLEYDRTGAVSLFALLRPYSYNLHVHQHENTMRRPRNGCSQIPSTHLIMMSTHARFRFFIFFPPRVRKQFKRSIVKKRFWYFYYSVFLFEIHSPWCI